MLFLFPHAVGAVRGIKSCAVQYAVNLAVGCAECRLPVLRAVAVADAERGEGELWLWLPAPEIC